MAGKRRNTTPTGTWCIIGLVGVVAILALIFGAMSFDALRKLQNQQPPSEFEAQGDSRFIMPQKKLFIGMDTEPRGRSPNIHNVETGEVGAIFFGDQAEILVDSDGLSSKMTVDLNFNTTDLLKGNGPPCGGSPPPLTIDPRNNECPRGFVGINNNDPQCHLHVNETMCVEGETLFSGNVTINGILFVDNIAGVNVTTVQCNNDGQCNDLNNCTTDQCVSNFCEHSLAGSCASSNDCPGNGVCGSACTCMEFVKSQCDSDFDCDDSNLCTGDTCIGGICKNEYIPFCCTSDAHCNDFNNCTTDQCVSNSCAHSLVNSCASSNDCPDNGVCGSDCICSPFVRACGFDSQCNDSDTCTFDTCVNGICENKVPDGDCNADHFCNSNEICNVGACSCELTCNQTECNTFPCEVWTCVNGDCVFLHEDVDCCTQNRDCDDFNVCTLNQCNDKTCEHPLINECAHSSDCEGNRICNSNCSCTEFVKAPCSRVCNFTDFYNQFELGSPPFPTASRFYKGAGQSVSVNNDKIIVGTAGGVGAAIILKRYADNIWTEEVFLNVPLNSTFQNDTYFGFEVKIRNDLAIVGCLTCFGNGNSSVFVYEFNSFTWVLVDILIFDSFPFFVIDLLDEKILISGFRSSSSKGFIEFYDRNETWELTQVIKLRDQIEFIGSLEFDKRNSNSFALGYQGGADLYSFNGTQYNLVSENFTKNELGFSSLFSVSFDDGIVVVGSRDGHPVTRVYSVSGVNVTFLQFLIEKHPNLESNCGNSVAISNNTIIVGCRDQVVNGILIGSAYVYKKIGDRYEFVANMIPPLNGNDNVNIQYGFDVDIDAETIVIGARLFNSFGPHVGNVYITRCTERQIC